MALRIILWKGKCRNYGECDKASSQEIFEIEEGQPFECPECHEPLTPLDGPKDKNGGKKKKPKVNPIVYVGGVGILLIAGLVAWLILKPSSDRPAVKKQEQVARVEGESKVAVDTTNVETVKVDTQKIVETETQQPQEAVEEPKGKSPGQPNVAPAKHTLSYGTWTGGWKNGKPHGSGTLTYSRATLIDSRDPKGREAQPGEYIIGEWDNGHLVQGRWFKNDDTKEQITIGKAG